VIGSRRKELYNTTSTNHELDVSVWLKIRILAYSTREEVANGLLYRFKGSGRKPGNN
jgi:hypothetical protein